MIEIRNLLITLLNTDTRARSSTTWLPLSLSFLFLCALNICDIGLGVTMRFPEDTQIKILLFIAQSAFRTQHKSNRQSSNEDEINPILYPDLSDVDFGVSCSEELKGHVKRSQFLFEHLMTAGVCREQARMVLPQNMYTEYYGTCNLNNLLKFVDLRTHAGAQQEIQDVAYACLEIATNLWPTAINSYRNHHGV